MKLYIFVSQILIPHSLVPVPRLSAAMTTPSLNLAASTEVPVTMGLCVCWFGPAAEKCEGS
jgi:hypothetical protein